jgi:hypothetical protein
VTKKHEGKTHDPTHSQSEIITNRHIRSTKPWFHFPGWTPMERITVTTAPMISEYERQRPRLIRKNQQW